MGMSVESNSQCPMFFKELFIFWRPVLLRPQSHLVGACIMLTCVLTTYPFPHTQSLSFAHIYTHIPPPSVLLGRYLSAVTLDTFSVVVCSVRLHILCVIVIVIKAVWSTSFKRHISLNFHGIEIPGRKMCVGMEGDDANESNLSYSDGDDLRCMRESENKPLFNQKLLS